MKLLENYIKNILIQERRTNDIESLREYSKSGKYFISFTKLPKLGINPVGKWHNPLGIYAFRFTPEFFNENFIFDKIGFVYGNDYVQIFLPNVEITNLDKMTNDEAIMLIKKAKSFSRKAKFEEKKGKKTGDIKRTYTPQKERYSSFRNASTYDYENMPESNEKPGEKFLAETHELSGQDSFSWNILLRGIGIRALEGKLLHDEYSKPIAVFLDKSAINHVDMFENPLKKGPIASKIDKNHNPDHAAEQEEFDSMEFIDNAISIFGIWDPKDKNKIKKFEKLVKIYVSEIKKSDFDMSDDDQDLIEAVRDSLISKIIKKNGATSTTKNKKIPLWKAIQHDSLEEFKALINAGEKIDNEAIHSFITRWGFGDMNDEFADFFFENVKSHSRNKEYFDYMLNDLLHGMGSNTEKIKKKIKILKSLGANEMSYDEWKNFKAKF